MDYSAITNMVAEFWWLIAIMLVATVLKTPWFKGLSGEAWVKFAARVRLPLETYHRIHNVTLSTLDGTTQIDHIFVSCFGIFVVETKNMQGRCDPSPQNYKHVKTLEETLHLPSEVFHSVVVFAGDSTFKTSMPANVTKGGGYISYIKSFKVPVLTEVQVQAAVSQIQSARLAPTMATHRQHVQRLRGKSAPSDERHCPRCGKPMILRTAKRGDNIGNQFWGCSGYPNCNAIQNLN